MLERVESDKMDMEMQLKASDQEVNALMSGITTGSTARPRARTKRGGGKGGQGGRAARAEAAASEEVAVAVEAVEVEAMTIQMVAGRPAEARATAVAGDRMAVAMAAALTPARINLRVVTAMMRTFLSSSTSERRISSSRLRFA